MPRGPSANEPGRTGSTPAERVPEADAAVATISAARALGQTRRDLGTSTRRYWRKTGTVPVCSPFVPSLCGMCADLPRCRKSLVARHELLVRPLRQPRLDLQLERLEAVELRPRPRLARHRPP